MSVPTFSNIDKAANDLLFDDAWVLNVDARKVEVNSKGSNIKVTGAVDEAAGKTSGSLKMKYSAGKTSLTETWDNAGKFKAKAEFSASKDLKLIGEGSYKEGAKIEKLLKADAEYKAAAFTLAPGLSFGRGGKPDVEGLALKFGSSFKYNDFTVGTSTAYNQSSGTTFPLDVKAQFANGGSSLNVYLKNIVKFGSVDSSVKKSVYGLSFLHNVNGDVTVGGRYQVDQNSKTDAGAVITLGAKYKLDSTTSLRAKIATGKTSNVVDAWYETKLGSNLKLGLFGQVNCTKFTKAEAGAMKTGVKATFDF